MNVSITMAYSVETVPTWVPQSAWHYLAHTEIGAPIRVLARKAGCHASTVLRQIRSLEALRDDYLVNEALSRLGRQVKYQMSAGSRESENPMNVQNFTTGATQTLTEDQLKADALRVLRRMCERGAVLAVAAGMDKAAVIRQTASGTQSRTAIVDRSIAEAMALKGWIACESDGKVAQYRVTASGRSALNHLMAERENKATTFYETEGDFLGAAAELANSGELTSAQRGRAETPLTLLARRRDKDGNLFLPTELVNVGEKLREDFELAQLGGMDMDRLHRVLDGTAEPSEKAAKNTPEDRVLRALKTLGPGLGDAVLRCCCLLEGLETVERVLGWSARSGKIVLRIALQHLKRFYDDLGESAQMIG